MAWSPRVREASAGTNPERAGPRPAAPDPDPAPASRGGGHDKPTYGQILKSSAVMGGSSLVNIGIGVVRTKAMAVLLGPAGVGLLGLYGAVADLAQSVAGMGLVSSGVRQIAEAAGSGDTDRIARTALVLRRTSVLLGILGAILLAALSGPVSLLTFGSEDRAGAVALLSVAVLFRVVSDGQAALLQGLRRIADLAKVGMLGALSGALIGIALVYWLGEPGIAPSLVGMAAVGTLISWWYSRKVSVGVPVLTVPRVRREVAALLKLGFAFMASGLMMMGAAYAIRIMVLREVGVEAAGLYQSAWALGGLYVGLVLQAMGADFYPRLTAIAKDNAACNRIVNEQAHVSLLLGGPGVLATLALAPWVIAVFYSAKFEPAVEILRWLCLGMALRIVSWPMGFILLAKGAQRSFFWSEAAWTVVYLGLAWAGVRAFGLSGAGIAFFGSYVFHCLMIYGIVRRLSGFRGSAGSRETGLIYLGLIAAVFSGFSLLPPASALGIGLAATVLGSVYSIQVLMNLLAGGRIPPRLEKWLAWWRITVGRAPSRGVPGIIHSPAGARAVPTGNPPMIQTLIAGFMIGTFLYIWAEWYDRRYGWRAVTDWWMPELPNMGLEIYRRLLETGW